MAATIADTVWVLFHSFLNNDFVQRFTRLPTHGEKLRFIGKALEKGNLLHLLGRNTPDRKDNCKAGEFRTKGNGFMQSASGPRRQLIAAAEAYNQALAYAEEGSEETAKAYGNRSAVCHALEEYSLALENIELAKAKGRCDATLMGRLNARKEACEEMLKRAQPKDPEYYEATLPNANPKIPRVAEGITLERNEEFGRHLVATRDFAIGEFILIDEPYAVTWRSPESEAYSRCHHCLRVRVLQLLPCPECVTVMFCSDKCATAAKAYHRMECQVLQKMFEVTDLFLMTAPRIVCLAIDAFGDDLERLQDHIDQIDPNFTAFELDWTSITPQQMYDTIHVLCTSEAERPPIKNIGLAVRAYLLAETMIRYSPVIQRLATSEKKRSTIRALMYRHAMSIDVNIVDVAIEYDISAYPLLTMVNHCCTPNTTLIPIAGCRTALAAHRPIKAGDQITYPYGLSVAQIFAAGRQKFLQENFYFTCRCKACINNVDMPLAYPEQLHEMDYFHHIVPLDNMRDMLESEPLSAIVTTKMFEKLNAKMRKYASIYPTKYTHRLLKTWVDCLMAVHNEHSLEKKYRHVCYFRSMMFADFMKGNNA